MDSNNLYKKCYAFAIRIVKAHQHLSTEKREFTLSKQLLRSGTSIGANVAEANDGISVADFSSKISLAYKESLETKYWLSLLRDTGYLDISVAESMLGDADELSKILFSILKSTRLKAKDSGK
ncbi:four helix bundle protein [Pontibacter sp. E15-1]|uniref:four helix bundle protein n=1 Tax=Pontibacter sp. E15-1 TaxID=2919918 RepID=UPI001F503E98|nr:four helix bundle protein [Pontibacter sp. E15-1]MCJ8166803.1 four helix bundle protein [Pontibacter sp. E15-1]